jgi:lactoylglutathione lyase/glyoxylase I family protein
MFSRLAHVCLNVCDLRRSVEFYTRLGFRTSFDFTRKGSHFGAYLEIAPNQYLELFENPEARAGDHGGIVHFCLETSDMDRLVADLAKCGIPHTPKKLGCDQTWQIWLKDPDGNDFEVHQYTAQSTQVLGGTVEADW